MSSEAEPLLAQIQTLLAEGRKIEAIKRYREATGAGLAAAKEMVEAIERGEPLPKTEPMGSSSEMEIVSLLTAGKKIEAIKLCQERTGAGLKEAKDAVEAIAAGHGIVARPGSGCLVVLLLLTAISVAALALTVKHGVVELRYATTEKKSDSATFASPLIVSIPKGEYKSVEFTENGKSVKKVETGKKADAKEKPELQRREVFFSGHVQGVGFRQTTSTLANGFTVSGFVKNLPDGRVQLVVEGQPKEVESFLAAIRKKMEKNISKTEEKTSPATGEFRGFGIR
ncbi:MAG: acylphosphatase [Thermoguttaceae bacterium]